LQVEQKAARTRTSIRWKTGIEVVALASQMREKAVSEVLRQHFVQHPLASISA
jgi:hypothetical protein